MRTALEAGTLTRRRTRVTVGLDCNALLILSAFPFQWLPCVHTDFLFLSSANKRSLKRQTPKDQNIPIVAQLFIFRDQLRADNVKMFQPVISNLIGRAEPVCDDVDIWLPPAQSDQITRITGRTHISKALVSDSSLHESNFFFEALVSEAACWPFDAPP